VFKGTVLSFSNYDSWCCGQLCEMVGKDGPSDGSSSTAGVGTGADASSIKKQGSVLDWVALRNRAATMEEKQHWVCLVGLRILVQFTANVFCIVNWFIAYTWS
jgi:hypothetical protein